MIGATIARRQRELENGNMRIVALEQTEELIAARMAEIDANLVIVRALLQRNEQLKMLNQRARALAGELEARGRQGRQAA